MYAGTTLRDSSGNVLGAHQKFDRIARRHLNRLLPAADFPAIREILHFEGVNGPDGLKRKSPARDEPWHYYDPQDPQDGELLIMIRNHTVNLANALQRRNRERAAFEAAWLAHALVDGLTPAHHYPLEEKLEELRGEPIETRTSLKEKLVISGETRRDMLRKNWEFWGAKGIMTTHGLFEWGVATTIAPLKLREGLPSEEELSRVRVEGIVPMYKETARYIASLDMYREFQRSGWTRRLAKQTREELAPLIVKMITLAWYAAMQRSQESAV